MKVKWKIYAYLEKETCHEYSWQPHCPFHTSLAQHFINTDAPPYFWRHLHLWLKIKCQSPDYQKTSYFWAVNIWKVHSIKNNYIFQSNFSCFLLKIGVWWNSTGSQRCHSICNSNLKGPNLLSTLRDVLCIQ